MISLRYHVISIAAVFLALAVGVVLVLAAFVAVAVALAVSGVGSAYAGWAGDTWHSFVSWIEGLFS